MSVWHALRTKSEHIYVSIVMLKKQEILIN